MRPYDSMYTPHKESYPSSSERWLWKLSNKGSWSVCTYAVTRTMRLCAQAKLLTEQRQQQIVDLVRNSDSLLTSKDQTIAKILLRTPWVVLACTQITGEDFS